MRRAIFLLLALAGLSTAQTVSIAVSGGATGRVVRPGASETLSFQVRRGTAAVADTDVVLSAPAEGPSGVFSGAAGAGNRLTVKTNAAGVATANLVVNNVTGWFRVDAAVESVGALSASVSFSSFVTPPAVTGDAAAARTQLLRADASLGAAGTVLHGPWLVPEGVTIQEAFPASRGLPIYPKGLNWLFWLDTDPEANFGHRTSFVLLSASTAAEAAATKSLGWPAQWWPVLESGLGRYSLGAVAESGLRGGSSLRAAVALRAAEATDCAILFMGRHNRAAEGTLKLWEKWLLDSGTVDGGNIQMRQDNAGNPLAASGEWLREAVRAAVAKGCKKIYLIGHSHGSEQSPTGEIGGLGLAPDEAHANGVVPYTELRDILGEAKGVKLCILLQSCYSGQLSYALAGAGLDGVLFTDADKDTPSLNIQSFGGAFSLAAINKLRQDPKLTFEEACRQVQADPDAAQRDLIKDGIPLPNGGRAIVGNPEAVPGSMIGRSKPKAGSLSAEVRPLVLSSIFLPRPGATGNYWVKHPQPVLFPYRLTLTHNQPVIAAISDVGREVMIPRSTGDFMGTATGLEAGESTYTGKSVDAANVRSEDTYRVVVGRFRLNNQYVVMFVGDTVAVDGTPFGAPKGGAPASELRLHTVRSNDEQVADVTGVAAEAGGNFRFFLNGKSVGRTTVAVHPENDPEAVQTVYVYVLARPSATACAGEYVGPMTWAVISGGIHLPFTGNPARTTVGLNLTGTTGLFAGGAPQVPEATGPMGCTATSASGILKGISSTGIAGRTDVPVQYDIKLAPVTPAPGGQAVTPNRQAFAAVNADVVMTLGDGVFPGEPLVMRGTGRLTGGPLCSYQFSPASLGPNAAAGQKSVQVIASEKTCAWTVTSNNPWATFVGARGGTGSGSFTVAWTANPGPARNAILTVGRQTLRIDQTAVAGNKPEILSVVSDGSFLSGYAPSSWVAILGTNLSRTTRTWAGGDFAGTRLPEVLDGVEVSFNGRRGHPYFISPGQINVLAPDDATLGEVQVTVKNASGTSEPFTVSARAEVSPALFTLKAGYPAATNAEGVLIGPENLLPGAKTVAARPGQPVTLYGTGFGETSPLSPANTLVSGAPRTATPVTARIGTQEATVLYAGKISSGLYQINLLVPAMGDGEHELVLTVRGARTPQRLLLRVEKE